MVKIDPWIQFPKQRNAFTDKNWDSRDDHFINQIFLQKTVNDGSTVDVQSVMTITMYNMVAQKDLFFLHQPVSVCR